MCLKICIFLSTCLCVNTEQMEISILYYLANFSYFTDLLWHACIVILTLLGQEKNGCYFLKKISISTFHPMTVSYFDTNFIHVCSYGSNWQWVDIGSRHFLTKALHDPNITLLNDGYMSSSRNESILVRFDYDIFIVPCHATYIIVTIDVFTFNRLLGENSIV